MTTAAVSAFHWSRSPCASWAIVDHTDCPDGADADGAVAIKLLLDVTIDRPLSVVDIAGNDEVSRTQRSDK